jgi:uracil-DNA glycosylase family 4
MNSFAQGLDLLLRQLRRLDAGNRPRFDQSVLDRIQRWETQIAHSEEGFVICAPAIEARSTPSQIEPLERARPEPAERVAEEFSKPDSAGRTLRNENQEERLAALRETVSICMKCAHLAQFRHTVVFGVGNPRAELMFVGEAPGADEDLRGEPFVGRAGELLTRIIETMGFTRDSVYIANVLKCRPDMPKGSSGNRPPTVEEMQTCLPYLRAQIEIIQPKVMVALGGIAMRGLFGTSEPMRSLRGRWHSFGNIPVMATFHPSYLLRNQALSEKRKVWEDMLQVLERLQVQITQRQRNFFLGKG